ncbi:MAG: hypothetical protein LUE86_02200 [Clostridiales bacterium]|nr:hypothetical protein [Clostridiales bacterium]
MKETLYLKLSDEGSENVAEFSNLLAAKNLVIVDPNFEMYGARIVELMHRLTYAGYTGEIQFFCKTPDIRRWAERTIVEEAGRIILYFTEQDVKKDAGRLSRLVRFVSTSNDPPDITLMIDTKLSRRTDIQEIGIDRLADVKWTAADEILRIRTEYEENCVSFHILGE